MKALLRFFTSVRLAIVLLIFIILASMVGTLLPQGRSAEEYLTRYGQLSALLQRIQLTNVYQSFWYIGLLCLFSLNILICTLTRLSPKIRRVFRPQLGSEALSLLTLKIKDRFKLPGDVHSIQEIVKRELRRRHYRVRGKEAAGKVFLLGQKRALGRFGSDIVHMGILIILAGGILSGLASHRQSLTLPEGQTIPIAGADFSVRLDKFVTEYYPNGSVKDWKSHLTVLEKGKEVRQKAIEVNHPLKHRGYLFYQSGYGWDWPRARLEIWVRKSDQASAIEKIFLRVGQKQSLEGGNIDVMAHRFLPDFVLDERRQPATRSLEPHNPAVFLESWKNGEKVFSGWVFAKFPDFGRVHGTAAADLSFELKDIDAPPYSVIQMAKDPGVPLIWLGCAVLMGGLFLAFYWPSRELRIVIEETNGKSELTAGGSASKGSDAFEREFSAIMDSLRKTR